MDIGKLRHKVDIQQLVITKDEYKQPLENWSDVYTSVWASVEPISGRDFFSAEKVNSEITHKVRIRYKEGITPKMRIKFGNRYFDITNVLNWQERNIFLEIMCTEVV